jgi:hypothetical protein
MFFPPRADYSPFCRRKYAPQARKVHAALAARLARGNNAEIFFAKISNRLLI